MRRVALTALLLAPCLAAGSLAQVGTWQAYMAYAEPQQIVKGGNMLYVRASNDLYQYSLNDHSITTYDKMTGLSDTYITHIAWNQQARRLLIVYRNSNIDLMDTAGSITNIPALFRKATTADKTVDSVTIDGPYAYLYTGLGIVKVNMQRAEISDTYTAGHPEYPTALPPCGGDDSADYADLVSTLRPGGPKYNYFADVRFTAGKLYTAGGYFISGGADLDRPGIVQVWDGSDWQVCQERIDTISGYQYKDNNCVSADPTDATHVAVGGRCGLYEFSNGRLLKIHNQQNSPLGGAIDNGKTLGNDYTLINGMTYDADGNLWVLNSQAGGVNLLELGNDGQWTSHYQEALSSDGVGLKGLQAATIDSRGYLWMVNNNWEQPSFYCYDTKNRRMVNSFRTLVNQDGTTYSEYTPYCVAEDLEGNIWIGTNKGPFFVDKANISTADTYLTQVKVPRNDGSDFADYLLADVATNCIAIDGGGRKWIGTRGAGAYLISADNMTQIEHFTTENSPLLSDVIESMAIDNTTGKVYFGTDNGLCSYTADATTTAAEMTKDNVYAYPNPVTPDYTGLITVVGLTLNADVKILSSAGKLIAQGRSNGGTFTWDGHDRNGDRVASGVYMVVTATSDGKKGAVCKIAIVK